MDWAPSYSVWGSVLLSVWVGKSVNRYVTKVREREKE